MTFYDEEVFFENNEIVVRSSDPTGEREFGALLPISLFAVALLGSTLPWVTIRPFGNSRLRYNLTDVPGGVGLLWTLVLLAIPGLILLILGKRSGLIVLGLAAGAIGWLGTISGMLMGVVTSLLPSVELAGLDITKAQVGQGIGVPISILASLILGVIALRAMEQREKSQLVVVPILPVICLVPLFVIGMTHHIEWLTLRSESQSYNIQIPGDALFGSGLLLVGIWLGVGSWIIAIVLKRRIVMIVSGILSIAVGGVSFVYACLVWLGGSAVSWLLPQSVDGWIGAQVEPALYSTLVCGLVIIAAGFVSVLPGLSEKSIRFSNVRTLANRRVNLGELTGFLILLICVAATVYRITS